MKNKNYCGKLKLLYESIHKCLFPWWFNNNLVNILWTLWVLVLVNNFWQKDSNILELYWEGYMVLYHFLWVVPTFVINYGSTSLGLIQRTTVRSCTKIILGCFVFHVFELIYCPEYFIMGGCFIALKWGR